MPRRTLAPYLYTRDDAVTQTIRDIKYHGNKPPVGCTGHLMGTLLPLKQEQIGYVILMPLTLVRELERGHNQAAFLAEGISSVTGIPYLAHALRRTHFQGNQTHRNRMHRLKAIFGSFTLSSEVAPPNSHILLLDNVLAIGVTFAAALSALADIPLAQVFVGVLTVGVPMAQRALVVDQKSQYF